MNRFSTFSEANIPLLGLTEELELIHVQILMLYLLGK